MSNPFGIKPYKLNEKDLSQIIKSIIDNLHPYSREVNPVRFDYLYEWKCFRDEYNYIEKVVKRSELRIMLEYVK